MENNIRIEHSVSRPSEATRN